ALHNQFLCYFYITITSDDEVSEFATLATD
ncbi:MAG: hypothetical protein ACJAZG_002284, partial [Granulosicoccus sp.]